MTALGCNNVAQEGLVTLLCEMGVDPNQANNKGEVPRQVANLWEIAGGLELYNYLGISLPSYWDTKSVEWFDDT